MASNAAVVPVAADAANAAAVDIRFLVRSMAMDIYNLLKLVGIQFGNIAKSHCGKRLEEIGRNAERRETL